MVEILNFPPDYTALCSGTLLLRLSSAGCLRDKKSHGGVTGDKPDYDDEVLVAV